ncbi:MAG: GNAT family N-acetyltransferase [Anaerolineae bacterium]
MSEIISLAPRHSLAVAALHMQYLTTPFRDAPGRRLLSAYYQAVAQGSGAVGYVAEDGNQILGYVCGVWQPAELRTRLLKTQWPALVLWGPVSALLRPQLVVSFLRRLGRPAEEDAAQPIEGYELRPIVVDPAARGTGLAKRLVERLILDARSRGFERMHLFTEVDNQVAQAFYRKMGFDTTDAIHHSGSPAFRYELSLGDVE